MLLQRKFARLSKNDKTATYQVFRQWLREDRTLSEEEWKILIDASRQYPTMAQDPYTTAKGNSAVHIYCVPYMIIPPRNLSSNTLFWASSRKKDSHCN